MASDYETGGWVRCLAASVVLAALETVKDAVAHAPDRAQERKAMRALSWFRSPSRVHPFAYLNCCDLLDLDPAAGLVAVDHILAGDVFELDTDEPTIRACTPPTCSGCARVLFGRRPIWTWSPSTALVYCDRCRDDGGFLPAGATWHKLTMAERRVLVSRVRVKVSDLTAPSAPIGIKPEEWGKAVPILAEGKPFGH